MSSRSGLTRLTWLSLAFVSLSFPLSAEVIGHFPFDSSLESRLSPEKIQAELSAPPAYGTGRRGKALSFGDALIQTLVVSAQGGSFKGEGTAELWINPLRSSGIDKTAPFRLQLAVEGGLEVLVYKDPDQSNLICHIRKGGSVQNLFVPVYDWAKSAWQHLLFTWEGDRMDVYVNRQRAAAGTGAKPPSAVTGRATTFCLTISASESIAVEDLFIYDNSLTASQVEDQFISSYRKEKSYVPPIVRIPYVTEPPVREGKVDLKAWESAAVVGDFSVNWDGIRAAQQTWVYMMYDDQRLYFLYKTPVYGGKPVGIGPTERDVFPPGDSIEFFVMPKYTEASDFYQFAGSPWESIYDGVVRDTRWSGDWFYRCTFDAQGWLAELWVDSLAPMSASSPAEGSSWSMNFCRNWGSGAAAEKEKFTQWSPSGAYHNHRLFGKVVFGGKATMVPQVKSIAEVDPGHHTVSAQLDLLNTADAPKEAAVVYNFYAAGDFLPLGSIRRVITIPARQKQALALTYELKTGLEGIVEIRLSSPDEQDVYLQQMVKIRPQGNP